MQGFFHKNIFLTAILFLPCFFSYAQDLTFSKTFGGFANDEGHDIVALPDGSFLVTGANGSRGDTSFDAYLLKIDAVGDTIWQKSFGGPEQDGGNEITMTPDGKFFIAGHTESYGLGDCEAYLFLIDSSGDTLWTRTYGSVSDDAAYASAMSPDGNYFAVGLVGNGANGGDGFMLKISPAGKILWTKLFGGPGEDYFDQIRATPDGNFLLSGTTSANGDEDFWLVKVDTAGNVLSDVSYSSPDNQVAYGLRIAPDSGAMVVGVSNDSAFTTGSIVLLRTDKNGEVLWSSNIVNSSSCEGNSVVYSATDTSWIICGAAYNAAHNSTDAFLMKVDDSGNTKWLKYFGGSGSDEARRLTMCNNGDIIFTGFTESSGAGMKDVFVVRVSSNGDLLSGISETKAANSFSVQPNPLSDYTLIRFSSSLINPKIAVYDLFGRKVKTISDAKSGLVKFDRENLPCGVYFIQLTDNSKLIQTQKVVIN